MRFFKTIFLLCFLGVFTLHAEDVNQVISDEKNKLQWADNAGMKEEIIFKLAKSYCKQLKLESYNDWRLPTLMELNGLAKNIEIKKKFNHLDSQIFWSTTVDSKEEGAMRIVYLKNGFQSSDDSCNENYGLCVRKNFK